MTHRRRDQDYTPQPVEQGTEDDNTLFQVQLQLQELVMMGEPNETATSSTPPGGLRSFSGKGPEVFKNWCQTCIVLSLLSRRTFTTQINDRSGQPHPTRRGKRTTSQTHGLLCTWGYPRPMPGRLRPSRHYQLIRFGQHGGTSVLPLVHTQKWPAVTRGYEQKAWKEHRVYTYMTATDETIRCKSAKPMATTLQARARSGRLDRRSSP